MSLVLKQKILKLTQEIKKLEKHKFCEEIIKLLEDDVEHHPSAYSNTLNTASILEQNPSLYLLNTSEQIAILDQNSHFLTVNQAYANAVGYEKDEQLLGLSYSNFKAEAVSQSEFFTQQDKHVMESQKPLEFLSYHRYADGNWHLLWGEKNIILDEHQKSLGVISKAKDMTHHPLIDVSRFLMQEVDGQFGRFRQKSFIYYVEKDYENFGMTPKEKEILFYLIRGKTVIDIANLLSRSKRTIDMHVESLKQKFLVDSKAHLIEKAISYGYMNFIPKTFFRSFYA